MTAWSALKEGFDAFIGQLPLLLGAWLVVLTCQQVINLLIPNSWLLAQTVISMVVLSPLYAGQYLLALKVVRREPVVFKELFAGMTRWAPILGAYLVVGLLTALGFIALIVPGIIVSLMFAFAPIRFLDQREGERNVRMTEAMSESVQITKGYRGVLFGVGFLLAIPVIVLSIAITRPFGLSINPWLLQLISILAGSLFIGPVQATSFMVIYDHALDHRRSFATRQAMD